MEFRVLNYFVTVAREENISSATETLHITQPTLSRQLKDLEDKLGKTLFIRGKRKITLTEEGMLLRKRAEEIINLVKKTEKEISLSNEIIGWDIYIGTGESDSIRIIADTIQKLQKKYPDIHYHISSGDSFDVMENLDKGLIDFGILIGNIDKTKYNYITLPVKDVWGVLMRKDSLLSKKDSVTPEDLKNKPLIVSRQIDTNSNLFKWFKSDLSDLNIIATYNLVYNASILVDKGLGYALILDKLVNVTDTTKLCFKPLFPKLDLEINIVWKKYQFFSKASQKFLDELQKEIDTSI